MVHYVHTYDSIVYMYTRMPPHGYADHPQDERSHHTFTRTYERFDLWRIIITILLFGLPLYMIRKIFDCKKCPVHLASIVYQTWRSICSIHWRHFFFPLFIKHDGLFVSYIVHIFCSPLSNMTVYSFRTLSTIFFSVYQTWRSICFIHRRHFFKKTREWWLSLS